MRRSEAHLQAQACRARLGRVHVAVGHRRRLAGQLRLVEVLDVVDLAVEQVEHVERQLGVGTELAADAQVGQSPSCTSARCCLRSARPGRGSAAAAWPTRGPGRAAWRPPRPRGRSRWGCGRRCRSAHGSTRSRRRAATTAPAPSGCSTRRRAACWPRSARWCRRRPRRPARSRSSGSTARANSAARRSLRCARRTRSLWP